MSSGNNSGTTDNPPVNPTLQNPLEVTDEVLTDEQDDHVTDEDGQTSNSVSGPSKACAKDWDFALLRDCSARRLRVIAKDYPGLDSKANKPEAYQHILEAMLDDQDCTTCKGNCSPDSHFFPPSVPPPQGWRRGLDGLFTAPVTTDPTAASPTIPPPPASAPAIQPTPASGAPSLPHVPPALQPAAPSQGSFAGIDLSAGTNRSGSPSAAILRNTGSTDLPISTTASPYIPGIQQLAPVPRDPARFVIDGAAAAAAAGSLGAIPKSVQFACPTTATRPITTPAPGTSASHGQPTADQVRQQIEASKLRRQKELEEAQRQVLLAQQQQAQRDQLALIEADRAEERAHQERLRQIQAGCSPVPAASSPVFPAQHGAHFLSPALGAAAAPPSLSPLSQHGPSLLSAPPSHCSPTPAPSHGAHSPMFAAPAPAYPPTPAPGSSPMSITPAQLQAMIDQRLQAMSNTHISPAFHCHGSADSSVGADRGKLKTKQVVNTGMAARFGVFAQPVFEIDGDIESTDVSKMRKILHAGHDKVGAGLVLRQSIWPHRLMQATVPGYDSTEHKDLTFHQFINGMLTKILSETSEERMDPAMSNKFSFLQFLVEMSFNYEHKAVLETYAHMHNAFQMRTFEWTDTWASIDERLKSLRGRYSHSPQPVTFKKGARCSSCANKPANPGAGNGGGQPFRNQQPSSSKPDVNDVPKNYMKAHNICIKYNQGDKNGVKGCKEKGSHKNSSDQNVTLQHICAGCYAKSKLQEAHPVAGCHNGPFKSLFRGW